MFLVYPCWPIIITRVFVEGGWEGDSQERGCADGKQRARIRDLKMPHCGFEGGGGPTARSWRRDSARGLCRECGPADILVSAPETHSGFLISRNTFVLF